MPNPIIYQLNVDGIINATPVDHPVGQQVSSGAANTSTTTKPETGLVTNVGNYILSNVHINALGGSPSGDVLLPVNGVMAAGNYNALGAEGKPVGTIAGHLDTVNDVSAIGNNLMAGRFLAASMEAAGAFTGGAAGAGSAFSAGAGLNALSTFLGLTPGGLMVRAGQAAVFYAGDQYGEELGKDFVYSEWIRQAAPTLSNSLAFEPAHTNSDGTNYYVISVTGPDKQPQTFVFTDNPVSASMGSGTWDRYLPVVSQSIASEVVGSVLKDSGFNPNMTEAQWHVSQGRSMSGYENNAIGYEAHGAALTVGDGSQAEVRQPAIMVTTYRDEQTQAIIEARVQGELVNGQFRVTGGSYAQGMTPDGTVVIPGVVDDPNAPARLQTQQQQDLFAHGEAAYANGIGLDGKPWGTATTVSPNATQSWGQTGNSNFVTRTTEVTNPNGVVTRISETVDRSTGKVVTTHVHEDGNLVAASEGGHRWAINRDTGQMEHLVGPTGGGTGGAAAVVQPPRASSSSFVNGTGEHTVTLNPQGTLSDIVLLQNRAGNPITAADLLAANQRYTDVLNIPPGATLNVPVRVGDSLTIFQSSGAFELLNTRTGEITSVTRDAQGNTHQVISRPDGEDGRIYIERTIDAGTGEVISASAVRVDSFSGQVTAIDPQHLTPLAQGGDQVQDASTNALSGVMSQQDIEALLSGVPQPGPAIAVLADAGPGTMTDAGPINGYGSTPNTPPLPQPDPPREAANGSISLADLSATLSTAQGEQLLLALAAQGLSPTDIAAVTIHTNPDGSRILANSEGDVIGTLTDAASGSGTWTALQLNGQPAQYIGPQGQVMSQAQYTTAQVQDTAAGINLAGAVIGLENWGNLDDLARLNSIASLYSQIDNLGSAFGQGNHLPGDLGTLGSALGFISALDSGNDRGTRCVRMSAPQAVSLACRRMTPLCLSPLKSFLRAQRHGNCRREARLPRSRDGRKHSSVDDGQLCQKATS